MEIPNLMMLHSQQLLRYCKLLELRAPAVVLEKEKELIARSKKALFEHGISVVDELSLN